MEPFLALIIVAVIGNLVLMAALIAPPWRARSRAAPYPAASRRRQVWSG